MNNKNILFKCYTCGLIGEELEKQGYCLVRLKLIKGKVKTLKFKCFKCLLGLNS
jgi:hypothetical protein